MNKYRGRPWLDDSLYVLSNMCLAFVNVVMNLGSRLREDWNWTWLALWKRRDEWYFVRLYLCVLLYLRAPKQTRSGLRLDRKGKFNPFVACVSVAWERRIVNRLSETIPFSHTLLPAIRDRSRKLKLENVYLEEGYDAPKPTWSHDGRKEPTHLRQLEFSDLSESDRSLGLLDDATK